MNGRAHLVFIEIKMKEEGTYTCKFPDTITILIFKRNGVPVISISIGDAADFEYHIYLLQ